MFGIITLALLNPYPHICIARRSVELRAVCMNLERLVEVTTAATFAVNRTL